MLDPIIYLHIPKTAGTSFRVSAENYFGESGILRDYGADSGDTSKDIIKSYYASEDLNSLRELGLTRKLLCGHFSLPRYREVFPDSPIMTFFRDPMKRVVSEFVHFSNHYSFNGTLENFYRDPKFQNRQHHMLGGAKPTDLDFYGITEQYEKSLKMFNQRYATDLQVAELNKGEYSPASVVKPTPEQMDEIYHLNQADLNLYKHALTHFDEQATKPRIVGSDTTRYRGNFGGIRENKLYGWASDSKSDTPTKLNIAVNGVFIVSITADKNRPDLVRNGINTNGKCGFAVPLNALGDISLHDSISVTTEDGLFELPNSPLVMAA